MPFLRCPRMRAPHSARRELGWRARGGPNGELIQYVRPSARYRDQSQYIWTLCALGLYPDLSSQPRRDHRDGCRVIRGDYPAVPESSGETAVSTQPPSSDETPATPLLEDADEWTSRIRRVAVAALPPERLLPDRQPAY